MCLAVIDWQPGQNIPLRVVANRDEFRHRPTATMQWWQDLPILAGRDLSAGGTWLGFNTEGRFALLTNIRPGYIGHTAPLSRGELIVKYLSEFNDISTFHEWLQTTIPQYSGFNLILGERDRLFWCSSTHPKGQFLEAGIYGLSNDALDTPWPKLTLARQQMAQFSQSMLSNLVDHPILSSTELADDEQLPETGLPFDKEQMLSAQTITDSAYGTRCRTHFIQKIDGQFNIAEQQIGVLGNVESTSLFTTADAH